MKRNNKVKGFTLVELLAVIVILAIILVIAVPKVMSIIEDAKMGTLESTAKMIASGAEKQKVQNTVLGKTEEITCESVAKLNSGDYANCSITFEDNTAKVTIEGSGKFDGLWVCEGTKTNATAQKDSCSDIVNIEVNHPLFLKGQELTIDDFNVSVTYKDGSSKTLLKEPTLKIDDSMEGETIIFSDDGGDLDESQEYFYEGADGIQVTFDNSSEIGSSLVCDDALYIYSYNDDLYIKSTNLVKPIANKTYVFEGNKVVFNYIRCDGGTHYNATVKPMFYSESEFTVSPSVVPNTGESFDVTINITDSNVKKKISVNSNVYNIEDYIASHKGFDAVQTMEGETIDAGIRYVGSKDEVKNKVYFNCDDVDNKGISYGDETYDYASSCEIWNIVGLFDTKISTSASPVKRVKITNINSTFSASWDSSDGASWWNEEIGVSECSGINCGMGINQWGESTYSDGTFYEGADLMRLLSGYYIGEEGATCTYCNGSGQGECSQTCTKESLKNANMKVMTNNAKNMIEDVTWNLSAITWDNYSNENDIHYQPVSTGNSFTSGKACSNDVEDNCNDDVIRTGEWVGKVGLVYISDIKYSKGWLNGIHSITPASEYIYDFGRDSFTYYASMIMGNSLRSIPSSSSYKVSPTVYLKPGIKVISGNGDDKPYILAN